MKAIVLVLISTFIFGCSQKVSLDTISKGKMEVHRVAFIYSDKASTWDRATFSGNKVFLEIGEYWSEITIDPGGRHVTFKTDNLISYEQVK